MSLLFAGFALRIIIAYVLFPSSGFESDIGLFSAWARTMVEHGPSGFYEHAPSIDYPPAYMLVLWVVGLLGDVFAPFAGGDAVAATTALVKLPPILIDIAVGYLLYRLTLGFVRGRRNAQGLALGAAALYLFNPVTWYDSALWGQIDAIGALVVLATLALLFSGWSEAAAGMAVMAGLIKPQYGLVLAPFVGVVLLRRHLFRIGSGPVPTRVPDRLRGWFVGEQGPWRILTSASVGGLVLAGVLLIFGLDLIGFIELMGETLGGYPYLTVNAYNPWAFASSGGVDPMTAGGTWSRDDIPLIAGIPGGAIGWLLLGVGFAVGLVRVAIRDDRRSLVVALAFLSLAFFILPTRVHERYLFPVFALLPILAVLDRKWLWATVALALASFMNLHAVLTTPLYGTPNVDDLPFGEAFRSPFGVTLSALLHLAVFVFVVWRLRPSAEPPIQTVTGTTRVVGDAPGGLGGRAFEGVPRPSGVAMATRSRPMERSADAASGAAVLPRDAGPATPSHVPGWISSFGRRIRGGNVRRDRTHELAGERGGRLDRLDLLLLALVVLAALGVRTYRLSEPYGMHFDEVYHARTGTEFLQDWRYGIDHDIYEYTHPHMAKYFMAAGLAIAGNDRVTATADLGVPVTAAVVEERWSPDDQPGLRNGDRLYVATGDEIRVFDLRDRHHVATLEAPATSLAVADGDHLLYAADAFGGLWRFDTSILDRQRTGEGLGERLSPFRFAELDEPALGITVTSDEAALITRHAGDQLRSIESASGVELARVQRPAPAAVIPSESIKRVVVERAELADEAAAVVALADVLDETEDDIRSRIAADERAIIAVSIKSDKEAALDKLIDEGLTGVSIESGDTVAVAEQEGVSFLDHQTLEEVDFVSLGAPSTGLAMVRGLDDPTIYLATGDELAVVRVKGDEPATECGDCAVEMPGEVRDVYWNGASNQVHALGTSQDGAADTIYVVEPHGNAVYADARLPFSAAAVALDLQPDRPSEDRQDFLALSADGALGVVEVGDHAFAWRLPGVLMSGLLAICLYLLARILFRRRSVAVLVSLFGLVDGMFFANSRIAMNDIYVTTFMVAAFTAFAPLYLGIARSRIAVLLGLPLVGLLLGLAFASKWVGAYAVGGVMLALLLRSALGRLFALGGMVVLTSALGIMAITADPSVENARRNFLFLFLMLGLTVALAALMTVRPVRFTRDELRFAVLGPLLGGVALLAVGAVMTLSGAAAPTGSLLGGRNLLLVGGAGLAAVGVVAWLIARVAGRFGIGPMARGEPDVRARLLGPSTPAPEGWLRPGAFAGLPWLFALVCIGILPFAVYVFSYAPWAAMNNNEWGLPLIGSLPFMPAGGTGQTLLELTRGMYDYHNDLRASHPASSPWWAWPFDLKPVWFYQEGMANRTTGVIYDSGNLVLFWLSIPAVAWCAFQAWRRRSLSLTLIILGVMTMWLPWARIDRATFQYHVFTTLPFAFLALAYFVADLWHGPSWRTWMLARVAAAIALVAAPLLWLGRGALCGLANVESVRPNGQACNAVTQEFTLTTSTFLSAIVIVVGVSVLIWQLTMFAAQRRAGSDGSITVSPGVAGVLRRDALPGMVLPALTLVATLFALFVASSAGSTPIFEGPLGATGPSIVALPALVLLGVVAYVALGARDSRRWVGGFAIAATLWFLVWYPNLSGLPLPETIANNYLMTLPTYNYDFQFAVNTDAPYKQPLPVRDMALFAALLFGTVLVAMYATYAWRLERALRRLPFEPPSLPPPSMGPPLGPPATKAPPEAGTA